MLQTIKYQDFLNQFTEEVILALVAGMRERELEIIENNRIKKVVDTEKLKIRFANYTPRPINPPQVIKVQLPEKETLIPSIAPKNNQQMQQTQNTLVQKTTGQIYQQQAIEQTKSIQQQTTLAKTIETRATQLIQTQAVQATGEFGKITGLIQDLNITYIECPSENQNIIIKKGNQTIRTQITLSKEEMIAIIKVFSDKTRIPVVDGLLNARYGNLEISAIISDLISNSFIIKKDIIPMMAPRQYFPKPNYL